MLENLFPIFLVANDDRRPRRCGIWWITASKTKTAAQINERIRKNRLEYGKKLLDFCLEKAAAMGFGAVLFEGNIKFCSHCGFDYVRKFGIRYHDLPEGADERTALVKYRYEAANVSARLEEAEAMKKCISEYAPEAFSRLLALRRARADRFPYAYDYESRIEQIEGSAHFVELAALAQLDPEKAELCRKRLFSELSDPERYFPVRAVTYLSGAAFIACLRKYTSLDTDAFTHTPFSVEAIAGAAPCTLPKPGARVRECMDDWVEKTRIRIEKTLKKSELVLDGDYRLFAFNPYDALWDGRYAVLSAFIGYIEGTAHPTTDEELFSMMKILNGDFIAQLDEEMHFRRLWRQ